MERAADQPVNFEQQKTKFFSDLALSVKSALALHRKQGNWVRNEAGERDWGNVSEHCLVEAARVGVLADLIGLSADMHRDLVLAATLHDFYKKEEVRKLKADGGSWQSYAAAGEEAQQILEASGFSDRVVRLATSVGHETIPEAERLVGQSILSEENIAWLIMHYVDDYTIDANWVNKRSVNDSGILINDFDRRIARNNDQAKPSGKYHGLNLSGLDHFGELTYAAQERVGRMVEERLSQLVSSHSDELIHGWELPEVVDDHIRHQISQL